MFFEIKVFYVFVSEFFRQCILTFSRFLIFIVENLILSYRFHKYSINCNFPILENWQGYLEMTSNVAYSNQLFKLNIRRTVIFQILFSTFRLVFKACLKLIHGNVCHFPLKKYNLIAIRNFAFTITPNIFKTFQINGNENWFL